MKRLEQPRFFISNDQKTLFVELVESPPDGADPDTWQAEYVQTIEMTLPKASTRSPAPRSSER